jgi:hypothetical protein
LLFLLELAFFFEWNTGTGGQRDKETRGQGDKGTEDLWTNEHLKLDTQFMTTPFTKNEKE